MDGELFCYQCKSNLPAQFFSRDNTREKRGRRANICRACDAAKFRAWYLENRDKVILRARWNKLRRRVLLIGMTESDLDATIDGKSVARVLYEMLQPQFTPADRARQLLAVGSFTQADIARIVCVSRQRVHQIAQEMNALEPAPRILSSAEIDRARLAKEGKRRCSQCHNPTPLDGFYSTKTAVCKPCYRTMARNRARQKAQEKKGKS